MKDLIFGAVDKYTWNQVKPWAESIRESGFNGDVVILTYRVDTEEFIREAEKLNIQLIVASSDSWGNPIVHEQRDRDTVCHQLRFFHLWQFLSSTNENYRYVVTTDTRDVVFQSNPTEWLESRITLPNQFLAPSEGIMFKNEPWGTDNVLKGFGPYVLNDLQAAQVYNVGTITGTARAIQDLSLLIYTMGENRYIPNDQSAFNILVDMSLFNVYRIDHDSNWACQCGVMLDPEKVELFRNHWECPQPNIKDGIAYTSKGDKYVLLHQWDRVPELKASVEERYGV